MGITVLTLTKNESGRWLDSLLVQWKQIADAVIALDDNSDDTTREVLVAAGCRVVRRSGAQAAWGAEHSARAELYSLGVSSDAEWLLWLDADMGFIRSPKQFLLSLPAGVDACAFRLYDLWDGCLQYRDDAFWQAHQVPRVWAVRRDRCDPDAQFVQRGLHCGHLPALALNRVAVAPREISLMHYAYVRPEDRQRKYDAYLKNSQHLSLFEQQHAESIMDEARVLPLPYACKFEVTYG